MTENQFQKVLDSLDYIVRRLQADVASGSRPDQWTMEDLIRVANEASRAAIESALREQAVPEGWKLVPVEPTEDMLRPFYECHPEDLRLAWLAMQMFAPSAPQPAQAEQPKAAQQEPVEQWQKRHPLRTDGKWENTNEHDAKWWRDNSKGWEIRALYTAAPQREPMTVDQIHSQVADLDPNDRNLFGCGVRYAERFHGVGK